MRVTPDRDARRFGRTLAAVLGATVLAATLLSPAPTSAGSASVTVTARISPTFSLTLLTDGTVDFGDVALGSYHTAPGDQVLQVRSNRPWDFTDSSDNTIAVRGSTFERERLLRHETSTPFGTNLSPGVRTIECTYILDLTAPEAFDLPSDTEISATFGYTATQR